MYASDSGSSYVYAGCRLVTYVYIQKCPFKGSTGASWQWWATRDRDMPSKHDVSGLENDAKYMPLMYEVRGIHDGRNTL